MVLYRSSTSAQDQMRDVTPEQAQASMEAWMQWAGKAGDALVDLGSPLAPVATAGATATDTTPAVGGFSVLQAESSNAVRALLDGHPHLEMPGASIEILEFLPVPGT
jgi:hypothetical protein